MNKPYFSIIIPALNEAKYLPHLLEDLSQQTLQDFEVIIVDGRSDDQTVAKAKSFTKLLPSLQILTSPIRHVCTQRNRGATVAQAETFIFMDADNRIEPWFLQGVRYRVESETADILSPFIQPDDDTKSSKTIANALNVFLDIQMSLKPRYLMEACIIVSQECFKAVGGFDESINYAEGTVFLEKAISLNYSATILKDPVYTVSFRRIKKYGAAKFISNNLSLQLMDLLGIDQKHIQVGKIYPMLGGSIYDTRYKIKKTKISKFLKSITKLIKQL
jgi:glycosyltransferase involved in cell wall biosynthesis